jgi:hypothetical protein
MHQQLWGYKVEWKSVSRGTGGKKFEYHCFRQLHEYVNVSIKQDHSCSQISNPETVYVFMKGDIKLRTQDIHKASCVDAKELQKV